MSERETLDVDILIVGGGPAGLSAALRLAQLQKTAGKTLSVALLEKAAEPGAHLLSGAVLDPRALAELIPDYETRGAPLASKVQEDRVYFLTRSGRIKFPFTPPPLRNHGNYIISLQQFGKWMSGLIEAEGIDVFAGFAATELLMDGQRVVGVRTGDRGVGRHGEKRDTFEPGVDIRAKVTILADGVRGNLTKQLIRRSRITVGNQPQVFSIGIKELWDVPRGRLAAGTVVHTLGYPLDQKEFGGGFLYAMSEYASVGWLRCRSRLRRSDVRPACCVSAIQSASARKQPASGRPDDSVWREGAARRGMADTAGVRGRRSTDCRRRRGVPQFHAVERHSPGDEDRHARRRNRIRGGYRGRHVRGATGQL